MNMCCDIQFTNLFIKCTALNGFVVVGGGDDDVVVAAANSNDTLV